MTARAWKPSDLAINPRGYWDASDANSLTLSGNNVTAWRNKGASASAATQSSSGAQPTYSATARNGTPGLVFDGDRTMSFTPSGFPTNGTALYIMVVGFQSGTTNTGYYQSAFSYGSAYHSCEIYNAGQYVDYWNGGSRITSNTMWYGLDQIVEVSDDGTNATSFANGVQIDSGSVPNIATTDSGSIGTGTSYSGDHWNGVIQAIVVLDYQPSASDQQKLQGWASWTFGQNGANLPAGHAFKTAAPTVSVSSWRASLGSALVAEYSVSTGNSAGNAAYLADITGNGNSLVLSSGGSAIWSATAQNGKPGITLDSSSYFASPTTSSFAIGSTAGPNPAAAIGMVFTKTASSQYARFASYVGVNAGSSNDYSVIGNAIFAYDDGNGKIGVANASLGNNDAPISLNTPHILVSQFTGAQSEVYIDSAAAVTNPYTSTNFSSPGRMAIMGGGGSQEGGIFSAAIVSSRALTASERAGYLAEMQSSWIGSATTTPTTPSIYIGARTATAIYIGAMSPSAIYKGAQSFV